ncbi:hypothetical protein LI328DRAFT_159879 [Trichoderma asperelloides]|nr:hypothetical protein LI328DRAFT_159879 [Trichoderma asperelloides]
MQISIIILTTLMGSCLATAEIKFRERANLEERQTCAIPNIGCYSNRDCCGGLQCDFSESCCNDSSDGGFDKRQHCGCCRK